MKPRSPYCHRIFSAMGALCLASLPCSSSLAGSDIGLVVKSSLLEKATQEVLRTLSQDQPAFEKSFPPRKFQMKNLKATGMGELALSLATGALGLDTPKDLKLELGIQNPKISVKPKVSEIQFRKVNYDDLEIEFNITLADLNVTVPKIELKEQNILAKRKKNRNKVLSQNNVCNPRLNENRFYKSGIYADLINLKLSPNQKSRNSELTFKIAAKLRIHPSQNQNQIVVIEVENDAQKALTDHYRLTLGKALFPDIQLEINGKCYPLDTDQLNKILQEDLETLKDQIVAASVKIVLENGINSANESLKKIRFQPKYSFQLPKNPTNLKQNEPSSFDQILNQLENLQYSIGVDHLEDRNSDEFGAIFSDSISIRKNHSSLIQPLIQIENDFNSYVGKDTSDLILSVSKENLETKLSLIQSMKVLEKSVLIKGITIDDNGFKVHKVNNDTLAIVTHLKIDLNRMEGFKNWLGSKWEKLFGSTNGVIRLPIQINLTYNFKSIGEQSNRNLELKLWIYNQFSKTQFGEASNLDKASGLIRNQILEKIAEFQKQFTDQKLEIKTSEIEEKMGLSPYWIKVTQKGDVNFGFGLKSIRRFIPESKNSLK